MNTTSISLALIGLLAGMSASAETKDAKRPERSGARGPENPARQFNHMWKEADANEDGSLSLEEFSSLPRVTPLSAENRERLFQRLDKNGNQQIERPEMARPNPPEEEMRKRMMNFWELDSDKDGRVSKEEFAKGEVAQKIPDERRSMLFERLDTNGDGFITKEDKPKHRGEGRPDGESGPNPDRPFPHPERIDPTTFDTNQDKQLDFDEFSKMPMHQRLDEDQREDLFEKADQNGDLKLSPEEWSSLGIEGMFRGKDRDKQKD